jgi:signal transduction histidine kinase
VPRRIHARGIALVDVLLAATCLLLGQLAVWQGRVAGARWWVAPLLLLIGPAVLLRRHRPLVAVLLLDLVIALQAVVTWHAPEGGFYVLPGLVLLFSVGAHGGRRDVGIALVASVATYALHTAADPLVRTAEEVWAAAFWDALSLLALAVGLAVRGVRRSREADRLLAEAHQRQEAAVVQERQRIARDLHDVIAHHVSVSVVQAVAAQGVLGAEDGAAATPLRRIEASSREAMRELRRMLGVLREDTSDPVPDASPQPGLADLAVLLEAVEAAGLRASLQVDAGHLPEAIGLTVYRLVQESLTNVLKHAQATRVDVTVELVGDAVTVVVRDDGTGGPSAGAPGYGLTGMRERVEVFGGRLEAGRDRRGGWVVRAELPLGAP